MQANNRSQVTVFIIIGIIVLVLFFIIMATAKGPDTDTSKFLNPETPEEYVSSCLYSVSNEAMLRAGIYTGHMKKGSNNTLDNLNIIKERIEQFIDLNMPICINKLDTSKHGFNITASNIKSEVIFSSKTSVNVDGNMKVISEDKEIRLDKNTITLDIPFKDIHEAATNIMNYRVNNPYWEPSILNISDSINIEKSDYYYLKSGDYIFRLSDYGITR